MCCLTTLLKQILIGAGNGNWRKQSTKPQQTITFSRQQTHVFQSSTISHQSISLFLQPINQLPPLTNQPTSHSHQPPINQPPSTTHPSTNYPLSTHPPPTTSHPPTTSRPPTTSHPPTTHPPSTNSSIAVCRRHSTLHRRWWC